MAQLTRNLLYALVYRVFQEDSTMLRKDIAWVNVRGYNQTFLIPITK